LILPLLRSALLYSQMVTWVRPRAQCLRLYRVGLPCLVMDDLAHYTNIWYRRAAMARNTSITLGPHFDEFIAAQVQNGRYGSTSEVVRAGLRLLEETEGKLERLRRLLDEGEQSGIADYSYESVITELDNETH